MERRRYELSWNDLSKYKSELYGISALWIMLFHRYMVGCSIESDNMILQLVETMINKGNMAVDIFLFLSGCFLYQSYESCKGSLLTFEKRRITRLCLPVLFIDVPYWIFLLIKDWDVERFIVRISFGEFWINGNQTIWFVSFILICYLIYPFLYELIFQSDSRKNWPLYLILLGVFAVLYSISIAEGSFYDTYNVAITRFPIYIIGCCFGKLCKEGKIISSKTIIFSVLIILASMYIYMFQPMRGIWERLIYISCIAYVIVFLWILNFLNCKLLNKILSFLGNMSLELYLSHILFIYIYRDTKIYQEGSFLRYVMLLGLAILNGFVISTFEKKIRSQN